MSDSKIQICALYKFVALDDYSSLKTPLLSLLQSQQIKGTLLLASEGINGTVAGPKNSIDNMINWLKKDSRFIDLEYKISLSDEQPFNRLRVKLKKEIVTMGVTGIDPNKTVGTYVSPSEWNNLISDPDTILIDTRNDYEHQVGTFDGAINPKTETFREFPDYVDEHLSNNKNKKIAMFCTGGIRCEKSTALLKEKGFEEVYHLKGGILKYLEEIPENDSLWKGECFVFDDRVTVNHSLEPGSYDQCNACRLPITDEDKLGPLYQQGISCPHCFYKTSEKQKHRFAEREKQIKIAQSRGESHIGGDVKQINKIRKEQKNAYREFQKAKA